MAHIFKKLIIACSLLCSVNNRAISPVDIAKISYPAAAICAAGIYAYHHNKITLRDTTRNFLMGCLAGMVPVLNLLTVAQLAHKTNNSTKGNKDEWINMKDALGAVGWCGLIPGLLVWSSIAPFPLISPL